MKPSLDLTPMGEEDVFFFWNRLLRSFLGVVLRWLRVLSLEVLEIRLELLFLRRLVDFDLEVFMYYCLGQSLSICLEMF